MKVNFRTLHTSLIAFLFIGTSELGAQTITVLHNFPSPEETVVLALSGDVLFGTEGSGAVSTNGSVFALKKDGTGFAELHSFTGEDGATPLGGVTPSGGVLFGTTSAGGFSGNGTVFRMNIDGTGFTNLYSFGPTSGAYRTNADGARPQLGLVLSGETLFGTTQWGGSSGLGVVFRVATDGTGFENLHSFTGPDGMQPINFTISGDTLYGTAYTGRFTSTNNIEGSGAEMFSLKTDGTAFKVLYLFGDSNPIGSLVLSGNRFYGTTRSGGAYNGGTVYSFKVDGTDFRVLHSFLKADRSNGYQPQTGLVIWNNTLYGIMHEGGASYNGTVFAINVDGSNFTTFYTFPRYGDVLGKDTQNLILSGNKLYGSTSESVYSLAIDSQLSIVPYNGDLILAWPVIPSGFSLQYTTNLFSPVWTPSPLSPVTINGQNLVVSPRAGEQQFFRLSQ